jgi:NitT/TauT family transport system substrate-binding protein
MQRSIRRVWLMLPCLLSSLFFIALPLASCSNNASPTTGSTESMTLKVGQVANEISFFPMYVALHQNFYKAQGLTLDPAVPIMMGSGAKLTTAVEADSVEVGVGSVTNVFTISRIDAYIKMIGAVTSDYLLDIAVSKQFEAQTHLSASSSLTAKLQGLRGKKIAISAPGSATDALLTYLFKQEGLDAQKEVVKVNMGANTPAMLAALKTGRIDAAVVGPPGGQIAAQGGYGDAFISPVRGDIPAMQHQLFTVAYAKQKVIDAKPKAIAAFIRALAQAEDYIQQHPEQMPGMMASYLKVDQKTGSAAWVAVKASMPTSPLVNQQSYDISDQFHVKAGLIAVSLDYKNLVATDTMKNALGATSSSS